MGDEAATNIMKLTVTIAALALISLGTSASVPDNDFEDLSALFTELASVIQQPSAPTTRCQARAAWSNVLNELKSVFGTDNGSREYPVPSAIVKAARELDEHNSKDDSQLKKKESAPHSKKRACPQRSQDSPHAKESNRPTTQCVPTKYKPGQRVDVMVLGPNQRTSETWVPAVVHEVYCNGTYALHYPDGTRVTPALKTGIRDHHMRPHKAALIQPTKSNKTKCQRCKKKTQAIKQARSVPVDVTKSCVPSDYQQGQQVQVMVLQKGQTTSNVWMPATVESVSCAGKFSLKDHNGNAITPALHSGIEEYHIRPSPDPTEQELGFRVARAQQALNDAKDAFTAHEHAKKAAARKAEEHQAKKAEEEAARKAQEEAKAHQRATKVKVGQIEEAMAKARMEYKRQAEQKVCMTMLEQSCCGNHPKPPECKVYGCAQYC